MKKDLEDLINIADAVCFDVDSTVITEESIDVLALSLGVGDLVSQMTSSAMGGFTLFEDALKSRLDLINPSFENIENLKKNHPLQLTCGLETLINKLHNKGTHVYLVSGGFRQMINPIALKLKIPFENIYANNLLFDEDGNYNGFDTNEPTSKDGGKAKVIDKLIEQHNCKCVVMIGDGITDMQAKPPAKLFIGYGGIIERSKVKLGSDWFIKDFQEIIDILQ